MEREPLRRKIRRHLIDEILAGGLAPGERVRLASTAEELDVSMTPLRESLVELEAEGFVTSDPGRGYAVADFDPDEIRQVYPLIWTLEVSAVRSHPPADEDVERLEAINRRFGSRTEPEEARRLDLEWHATLLARCPNDLLLEILAVLKRRAARYELAYMRETGNISFSAGQHDEIVDHLRKRDLDAAAATLEENWRIGPDVLLPWLEERTHGDRQAGSSTSSSSTTTGGAP